MVPDAGVAGAAAAVSVVEPVADELPGLLVSNGVQLASTLIALGVGGLCGYLLAPWVERRRARAIKDVDREEAARVANAPPPATPQILWQAAWWIAEKSAWGRWQNAPSSACLSA